MGLEAALSRGPGPPRLGGCAAAGLPHGKDEAAVGLAARVVGGQPLGDASAHCFGLGGPCREQAGGRPWIVAVLGTLYEEA